MQQSGKFAYALLVAANMQIGIAAILHGDAREGCLVLVCAFAYLLFLAPHNNGK